MELIKPGLGLIFWMVVSFSIVLLILKKTAWTPILGAIREREKTIDNALNAAEKARKDMEKMKVENKQIIEAAIQERDSIISEAKEIKTRLINEAKDKASEEAHKIIEAAKSAIENEKMAAIIEIKEHLVNLSIDITEKVIKEQLKDKKQQERIVDEMLKNVKLS